MIVMRSWFRRLGASSLTAVLCVAVLCAGTSAVNAARARHALATHAIKKGPKVGAKIKTKAKTHMALGHVVKETVALHPMNHTTTSGKAIFTYTPNTNRTTVVVTVVHLKPMTMHPIHIHVGHCGMNGPVKYPLPTLHANKKGVATSSFRFSGRFPHHKWYVNVHRGPGISTPAQFTPIACGNVH